MRVKTTEAGGPRGYDAGKKIKGRKRHALVDTDGRGLVLEAHPASIQDRDGGGPLLCASRGSFPFIEKVFADSGYAGEKVATATVIAVEIVRKSPDQVGFAVQPAPLGRGALLRLDQPQPATGKGLRGHHRLGPRLPLRRLRHAPRPQIGPSRMTFETDSKRPLIITASVGRDPRAVPALKNLAERFAMPVVSFFARNLCFPADHAMHLGYEVDPLLAEADAVLVLECDVPWIPSLQGPPADAKIIHLGVDPLFRDYPTRGFRTDLAVTADPVIALPQLADAMATRVDEEQIEARRMHLAAARDELRASWKTDLDEQAKIRPIHPAWLTHCLDQVHDEDAIIVNEVGLLPQHLNLNCPETYFSPSPAGGLGWGLGAALGRQTGGAGARSHSRRR